MIIISSWVPSIYITKLSTSVANCPNIRPLNKGRIKSRAARQIYGQILADFVQKGLKRGRPSGKFVLLLFLFLVIAKSINYYTFPTDITKIFLFVKANAFKKGKLLRAEFYPQLPNFSAELAGKFCQELATLLSTVNKS
jgi:hypothetical protein